MNGIPPRPPFSHWQAPLPDAAPAAAPEPSDSAPLQEAPQPPLAPLAPGGIPPSLAHTNLGGTLLGDVASPQLASEGPDSDPEPADAPSPLLPGYAQSSDEEAESPLPGDIGDVPPAYSDPDSPVSE